MKSIVSLLSVIALGFGLLSCSGGGGGGGSSTSTIVVSTTAANFGVVNTPYISNLASTGGMAPFTWTLFGGVLPNGLSLNAGTGVVSGTPTAAGNFTATFTVTDNTGQTATGSVLFAIHPRTDVVSVDNSTPPVPGGSSSSPSISNDGRFVAFASSATLIPGVFGSQIYIHDWQTNQTSLVSQDAVGNAGNGASSQPTISADGRFVAFTSAASNLTGDPDPGPSQIFLRDTQLNITTLVSQATGVGVAVGGGASSQPTISEHGQFVAFTSAASNLTGDLDPGPSQIFLRDTQLNITMLVSQATGVGVAVGNGASSQPTISGDGQFVAFTSAASTLTGDLSSAPSQIFLRDTHLNITTLVSQATGVGVTVGGGASSQSTVSEHGQFVAFTSASSNLTGDLSSAPSQIFLRDTQLNITTLVSQATGVGVAVGDGASSQPTISDDGQFVAFTSASSNLTGDLSSAPSQIFLRDTVGNGTSLVSKDNSSLPVPGDGLSNTPSVSVNGGFVVFSSVSTNLGAVGGNQIYVRAMP